MKNRISEDLSIHFRTMSFACACLIVVLHACARPMFGTWNWVVAYCIGSGICQVAVPFFFLASGYFLAGRLCEEGWYGRSVRSRIHTLLVPFFSWRLICVVFGLCIAYGINAIGYSNYRGNIVIPDYSLNWWLNLPGLNPFENVGAIWYLRALFILVVASPCLVTFLRKIGAWTIISLFALYLLSVCMLEPNTRAWNFFEYFLSLRGLVYFCVGIYLRECEIRFVRGSGGLLLLSGWGLLVLKTYLASWGFSRGEAVVGCLMVPGLMFSVWWLTQHVKWPLSLTTMAFPLYLIHQMVLLVIAIGFAILGLSAYARTSLFGMGVKVFLAIAMSLTISIVVRRFNISKFLLLGGEGLMGVVKKRDPSFDLLKALAIYMVVLSHAIASAAVRSEHVCIVNFIVGVNMPLFFMISGYFAVGMITRGDKLKLVNRLIDYWWPVAVFSVVSAVWACGVQNTISVSGIPLKAVKQFLFSAWFFYALSICDGVTFFAYRFGKWNCVIGSFLLLLVVPPFWYKGDALNMLPFFLFGAFLLPKVLNMPKGVFVIVSTLCMAIYLGAVLFCGDFWENGLAFYTNYLDIYHFKPDLLSQFLTRCVLGLCGSLALIGVLRGLLASFPFIGGLAPIGEQTMGVYFIHRYGLAIFAGCGFFTDSLTGLFASAVLVFLFCSIIVAVSKRNRICRIALWGLKIKS